MGGEGVEALAGVLSSSKKEQEVQRDPPVPRIMTAQQGVDTWDLEQGMEKISISTQTGTEKVGTEERGLLLVEAGSGNMKGRRDDIPGGWE